MASEESEDDWDKKNLTEKLEDLGFDLESPISESGLTQDQRDTLHGALDMLAGAISVGHSTLEKTVISDCAVCAQVTEEWNELLKVE